MFLARLIIFYNLATSPEFSGSYLSFHWAVGLVQCQEDTNATYTQPKADRYGMSGEDRAAGNNKLQ